MHNNGIIALPVNNQITGFKYLVFLTSVQYFEFGGDVASIDVQNFIYVGEV